MGTKDSSGLETKHVRVRITGGDLHAFKVARAKGENITDRLNPVAKAINRTLRDGYAATFDGMSVGIVKTTTTPRQWEIGDADVYCENGSPLYRRLTDAGGTPFFRGVSNRVQQLHKLANAKRNVTPARLTVSLPVVALKRVAPEAAS